MRHDSGAALDRHQNDVIMTSMEIHVDAIRRDLLATATVFGDESLVETLRRLVDASEPALRLRLIDVLSEAAVSLNAQLGTGHVEVRLVGRDPELVYVGEPEAPADPAPGDELNARITLRLPEALKARVESTAAQEGVSANAWIVRALARAVEPSAGRRSANRLQGFARS
jgi:HicB family